MAIATDGFVNYIRKMKQSDYQGRLNHVTSALNAKNVQSAVNVISAKIAFLVNTVTTASTACCVMIAVHCWRKYYYRGNAESCKESTT